MTAAASAPARGATAAPPPPAAAPAAAAALGPVQLTLDLPHEADTRLEEFLKAPCNAAALDAVLGWPGWPVRVLVVSGPPASGRTHLARIWAARAGAAALRPAELLDPAAALARAAAAPALLLDDADALLWDEALLFHLHNAVVGRGGTLLLTARRPPADWPLALPDLRSRLLAAWPVRIEPPDETLLAALLVKQFADRQLRVEPAVVGYLVPRLERSFAAVRRVVGALDRASLRAQRPVTLPLARAVIELERDIATDAEREDED